MANPRVSFGSTSSALTAVVMTAAVLMGCTEVRPEKMTTEKWRQDLWYLEKELARRHAEPFKNVTAEAFRAAVQRLDQRIADLSDAAIQVEMGRLVAMLHDGHTELWLVREGLGFRNLPFFLYNYGGDVYVNIAHRRYQHLLGARVIAIEGTPIDEAIANVDPLIARDNAVEPLLSIPEYLGISEILYGVGLTASADSATFTFEQDGRRFDAVMPALSDSEGSADNWVRACADRPAPLYQQQRDRYYWFEYLNDSRTLYVKYNRCQDQSGQPSIKKFATALFKAFDDRPVGRLIVDVRNNRGGNYNESKPLIEGIERRADRLGPGTLFVITGRETFSAGMVTALQLKERTGAVLVGEPGRSAPNGSDNFEWFYLPHSRLRVDYTDRVATRAPEYANSDVLPVDIPIVNGFDDYREGRDRVLEAILTGSRP